MPALEITEKTLWKVTSLAYEDWFKASTILEEMVKETNDGSKDWKLFHDERLKNATNKEIEAKAVSDEMVAFHR